MKVLRSSSTTRRSWFIRTPQMEVTKLMSVAEALPASLPLVVFSKRRRRGDKVG